MQALPLQEQVLGTILTDAARAEPDRVFARLDGEAMTYTELDTASNQVANGLGRLGVSQGDHVCLMFTNASAFAFLQAWFGIVKLGAVAVPINPDFRGDLLAHVLNDSDTSVVIFAQEFMTRFEDVLPASPGVRQAVVSGHAVLERPAPNLEIHSFEQLRDSAATTSRSETVRHSDVATIVYSSGTTGPAKGILMPHAHAYAFARQWIEVMRYSSQDVLYSPTPLSYMLAMILGVLPTLLVRSEVCFAERFSASSYWDDIRRYSATVGHCIFSIIPILKKQPPSEQDRNHRCRALYIAKSDAEFEDRFGVRLVEIYGSTEMNIVAYNPWDAPKSGSCGLPAPNFEVQIVDDDDQPVAQGEVGEIVARPREPYLISYGYYKRPEKTVEAWGNLWFHCGDRGYFDEDGYLFYVDRKKDVIRRRGENISSYEVERQVAKHPSVLEAAAVPVPSELGEDEVMVFLVLTEDARSVAFDFDGFFDFCRSRLPRFMIPRYAEVIGELPKTQSMKIRKVELRDRGIGPGTADREAGEPNRATERRAGEMT